MLNLVWTLPFEEVTYIKETSNIIFGLYGSKQEKHAYKTIFLHEWIIVHKVHAWQVIFFDKSQLALLLGEVKGQPGHSDLKDWTLLYWQQKIKAVVIVKCV